MYGIQLVLVVVCVLLLPMPSSAVENDPNAGQAAPTEEGVAQLVRAAAADDPASPAATQATERLKTLGLDKHVVPLLENTDVDAEMIALQRAAVRVLLRCDFSDALDDLGSFLSVPRYSWPDDATRLGYQSLKRDVVGAIYSLTDRDSPIKAGDSPATIDTLIPPTLRLVSILKPADARQTPFGENDPRRGARIRLYLDKNEWLVGESVTIHFEVKNEGDQPLAIETGGDYRTWPARHLRFKVVAFDEAGNLVDDPYPDRMCMGGLGGASELKPGDSFWEAIPLWRHCGISRPGTYTIRVYHDLGWDRPGFDRTDATTPPPKPHLAPVVEAKISFREPKPDERRAVLVSVLSSPRDDNRSWGERARSFGEVTSIYSLSYLPLLRECIDAGGVACLEAIGIMPSPEATRALVELTAHERPAVRKRAVELLVQRLPNARWPRPNRTRLASESWRDEFREPALALGWKLLAHNDVENISNGAEIISAVGSPDDLPQLLTVLDRVLKDFQNDQQEQASYPRPANASGAVIGAASQLIAHGASPPTSATSAANGLAMLIGMVRDEKFRPDNWVEVARGLITHSIPYVRATALENLPAPIPPELQEIIIERLNDRFLPVQMAACNLASKEKLPAAAEPLAELLGTARDEWLINAAYNAAAECGVPRDRLTETCIQRLPERDRSQTFFTLLIRVLDTRGGYSASQVDWSVAARLQQEWTKLLEAKRTRIAAGEQLPASQPPVTPALFPRGFSITRNNGSDWPDWNAIPTDSLGTP